MYIFEGLFFGVDTPYQSFHGTELLLLSHDTPFIHNFSSIRVQTFTRCFRCTTAWWNAFWKHLRYTTNSADSQLVMKFGINQWHPIFVGLLRFRLKEPKWLVSGSAQRLLCIKVHIFRRTNFNLSQYPVSLWYHLILTWFHTVWYYLYLLI